MRLLYLCIIFIFENLLWGSTLVYMDLPDITRRSEAIIRGTVRESESAYNEERTKIFTFTIIEVNKSIKGKVPPVIKVRTYGGRVGDISMKVPGMPEFKKGEEVFLFLKKNEDFWHISGMIQGKYTIIKDEDGKEFLKNDFTGISFKKVNAENKLEDMNTGELSVKFEYQDFISKIKELIGKKETEETLSH